MGKLRMLGILMIVVVAAGIFFGTYLMRDEGEEEKQSYKIGVAVYNGEDSFISNITEEFDTLMRDYERSHEGVSVYIDIADARGSQREQNNQIEQYISWEYDIIFLNIVDRTNAAVIIDQVIEAGIPLIFFNREPVSEDILRGENIYYVGSNAKESALIEGDIIANAYIANPKDIDKNQNGVIEYAMLEGETGHQDSIIRSEWVIKHLVDKGLQVEKVVGEVANWDRSQAKVITEQWLRKYGSRIEIIISNNDDMALGAIDTFNVMGITGVQTVGIDGLDEALKAVERGDMLGTVVSDSSLYAQALREMFEATVTHDIRLRELPMEESRYYRTKFYGVTRENVAEAQRQE